MLCPIRLFRFLKKSDYSIREELVLKIAILAEKYAADYTWYTRLRHQFDPVAFARSTNATVTVPSDLWCACSTLLADWRTFGSVL